MFDLAAEKGIEVSPEFFDESDDSLSQSWAEVYKMHSPDGKGWMWLNPPFSGGPTAGGIDAWARKCWEESQRGARILFLAPHSADANWWRDWVRAKGRDEALAGRVKFVGQGYSFMKPLALIAYEPGVWGGDGGIWRWKPWVPDEFKHLLKEKRE